MILIDSDFHVLGFGSETHELVAFTPLQKDKRYRMAISIATEGKLMAVRNPIHASLWSGSDVTPYLSSQIAVVPELHSSVKLLIFLRWVEATNQIGYSLDLPSLKPTVRTLQVAPSQKETIVFQPSIFRGELLVSGRVHPTQ